MILAPHGSSAPTGSVVIHSACCGRCGARYEADTLDGARALVSQHIRAWHGARS